MRSAGTVRTRYRRSRLFVAATLSLALVVGGLVAGTPTAQAAYPGTNGKIFFTRYGNGGLLDQIWTMNPDGTSQTRLTSSSQYNREPHVNLQGNKVVFTKHNGTNAEIYVMNADGSGQTNLTNNTARDFKPQFSRDGTKIVFVREIGINEDVWVMNADGSGQTQLTTDTQDDSWPTFTQDGEQIIFHSYRTPRGLYAMDADGSGQHQIKNDVIAGYPDISPDGTKITFAHQEYGPGGSLPYHSIWTMDLDGSNPVRVTPGNTPDSEPTFSPDGTQIVFARGSDIAGSVNPMRIYRVNIDGSGLVQLTTDPRTSGHLDDDPVWAAKGPVAVCDAQPHPPEPGEFDFDATGSIDRVGLGLSYEWDFGDGATDIGSVSNHTYTTPGPPGATLTVTDGNGVEHTAPCDVDVPAPSLGVGISFPGVETAAFGIGEAVPVRLHLTATEGVGDLSDVAFVGDPLQVTPPAALTVTTAPDIPEVTLEPGEEETFDYELQAVQPGDFTLRSVATATDAAARLIGPVEVEREGRVGQLIVTVTVDPDQIELEEAVDESGPEPEDADVTVEVHNPLDVEVDNVVLRVLQPRLVTLRAPPPGYEAYTYLVPPDEPGPLPLVPGQPEDIELPDPIPPDGTVERTIPGRALDAGKVDLRILASGEVETGGEPATASVDGAGTKRIKILTDVILEFDAEPDLSDSDVELRPDLSGGFEAWVEGGATWQVVGHMKNRSLDETIEVVVIPGTQGNAGYAVPIPNGETPPDTQCGMGTVRTIDPGESVEFVAPVRTIPDGATRSTVLYDPVGSVIVDENTKTPLTSEQILVTTGSEEPFVHVDTRDRAPEELGAGEILWVYGESTLKAFDDLINNMARMAAETNAGVVLWEWPYALLHAGNKMADYVNHVYENLDDFDKNEWKTQWIAQFAFVTGQSILDATNAVNAMIEDSFTDLEIATHTGDSRAVAEWWGTLTGSAPDVAVGALGRALGVCKLIYRATPWARRAILAKEAALVAEVEALGATANAKNFPTGGFIGRDHRRGIWGIDDAMDTRVQAFVDESGIAISVRRRGPGSISKIEAGTHEPKPFNVKAKNTSATDVQIFGFVNDLDTAAIKKPPRRSQVEAALAGADTDRRAQVLARHETRTKEWFGKGPDPETNPSGYAQWLEDGTGADFSKSERAKWAKYQKEGLPVPAHGAPLDYSTNVSAARSLAPDDVAKLYRKVKARIREVDAPDGEIQMILEIDLFDTGNFKPITGDMDPLVLTKGDLKLLSEQQRIEFYKKAYDLGFEHVESASWNDPAGRNAYLQEFSIHNPDSESMFTWIPKSVPRATRFDPQKSWLKTPDPAKATGVLYLRGMNAVVKAPEPSLGAEIPDDDPPVHISPKTIFLVDPDCPDSAQDSDADTPPATCSVDFDDGPDSLVLRQLSDGAFQRWTAEDGWQPFTITTPGRVPLQPQTVATTGGSAGETSLETASQGTLGFENGIDDWFSIGDLVVIDPGGPNEEYAVISGFGSLIFAEPLTRDHEPGEIISRVVDRPNVTIAGKSKVLTTKSKASAKFSFTSDVSPVTFRCAVDSEPYAVCTSPFRTPKLKRGTHVLHVKATNSSGLTGPVTDKTFKIKKR